VTQDTKVKSKWTTRRKVLTLVAVLACAPMLAIPLGLFWELHEANKCPRGFSDALIAKEYERAYDFTSPELRAAADYPSFLKINDGLTLRMGALKSVDVENSEIKDHIYGWSGTVDADLTFERGTLSFVFVLKKTRGAWKIYSYREQ
jgi:hypothetical protein